MPEAKVHVMRDRHGLTINPASACRSKRLWIVEAIGSFSFEVSPLLFYAMESKAMELTSFPDNISRKSWPTLPSNLVIGAHRQRCRKWQGLFRVSVDLFLISTRRSASLTGRTVFSIRELACTPRIRSEEAERNQLHAASGYWPWLQPHCSNLQWDPMGGATPNASSSKIWFQWRCSEVHNEFWIQRNSFCTTKDHNTCPPNSRIWGEK